jgi:dinuclear metal center YbgI/SA1388 family protein
MRVNDVIAVIEEIAPLEFAASWDCCGVQVAARRGEVERLAVMLDPAPDCVARALGWDACFLLTHHPLALKPGLPDRLNAYHQVLGALLCQDVWLYAAHTSLDVQPAGPMRWLAKELGLKSVSVLEPTGAVRPYWFRILGHPESLALFARELEKRPGIEFFNVGPQALELVCFAGAASTVRSALRRGTGVGLRAISQGLEHPVETVGFGFVGAFSEPLHWDVLAADLARILERSAFALAGPMPEKIRRLACCPGSGASMLPLVKRSGAEVFITGDMKYHDARTAEELGILVVDVGHFSLEERMMRLLAEQLKAMLSCEGVHVEFFPGRDRIT